MARNVVEGGTGRKLAVATVREALIVRGIDPETVGGDVSLLGWEVDDCGDKAKMDAPAQNYGCLADDWVLGMTRVAKDLRGGYFRLNNGVALWRHATGLRLSWVG